MSVTVQSRQTLLDIALQECGGVEGVFNLAARNDLSITDVLSVGREIEAAPEDVVNRTVADYYRINNITPATEPDELLEEGIEFWTIEYDFEVS